MPSRETWVAAALLVALGIYGTWRGFPFFAVLGFGFAAARVSELAPSRRLQPMLAGLTFLGLGVTLLMDAVAKSDGWSAFGVLAGTFLSGTGAFVLWRLRRVPPS
jgi:uncharacterized membrane protein YccC